MSAYRIELRRSAAREFRRLPKPVKTRVEEALRLLAVNPYAEILGVRKLRGAADLFRVRVGDERILYEVREGLLTVVVIKLGHRSDVYRR